MTSLNSKASIFLEHSLFPSKAVRHLSHVLPLYFLIYRRYHLTLDFFSIYLPYTSPVPSTSHSNLIVLHNILTEKPEITFWPTQYLAYLGTQQMNWVLYLGVGWKKFTYCSYVLALAARTINWSLGPSTFRHTGV